MPSNVNKKNSIEVQKIIIKARRNEVKKLNLNNYNLDFFPLDILEIKSLEELILSNNKIRTIPINIGNLKKIQILNLNNNLLTKIPKEIIELKNLTQLGLHDNQIVELPDEIFQLYNLKVLGLNNNQIKNLSSKLINLTKLVLLGLSNNAIRKLPFELIRLRNLTTLLVEGNPLKSPPIEVAQSNNNINAIKNYFLELKKNTQKDYLYEIKLLIVGNGGVGKTSLAKTIAIYNHQFNMYHHSTNGIDIIRWIIPKEEFDQTTNTVKEKRTIKSDLRINVWDFGGQEIYHSTHQFFLTKRSIYFFLTESRREDTYEDFNYWLNIIELLGDESPVIIVQNKCDKPTKDLPLKQLKRRFNNIKGSIKVSCLPNYNHTILTLRHTLLSLITNKKLIHHLGTILPKPWVDIRNSLGTLREKGIPHISIQEYYSCCKEFGLDERAALYLSDFLHDLGIILHFQDEIELDDIVILNHEWATKGVYKILDNQNVIDKNGYFNNADLKKMWDTSEFRKNKKELLALMKKFELCFEVEKGYYLTPHLLPSDEPDFDFQKICEDARIKKLLLEVRYVYDFMPMGIITRLIVKLHNLIVSNYNWRFGVIFKYQKTYALVNSDINSKINILIRGEQKNEMLGILKSTINDIHISFKNLSYTEQIPCNCEKLEKGYKPYYFNVKDLNRRIEKNKMSVECQRCFDVHSVFDLLKGVSPKKIYSIIKKVISNHKIKESFNIIENKLKSINNYEFTNEFTILSVGFKALNENYRKKLISKEDFKVNLNEIIISILEFAKKIDDSVNSEY